jgi:hypothetical protein
VSDLCYDGGRFGKKKFTLKMAELAIVDARRRKIELYSYYCKFCGHYHTTSMPQDVTGQKNRGFQRHKNRKYDRNKYK